MTNFFDLDREMIRETVIGSGMRSFVADQLYTWIYKKRRYISSSWANISGTNRSLLSTIFNTNPGKIVKSIGDKNETLKILIELNDGLKIESVLIKEKHHYTFCISSQVGCPLACEFCATGKMGLKRNLSSGEIITQVLLLKDIIGEYSGKLNLVFMGMGESLLNYSNLRKAIIHLTDPEGIGISPRNITVSTSGILDNLMMLEKEFPNIKLSFSLNASDSEKREKLMPVSVKEKLDTLLSYFRKSSRKHRITFEYVLISGVNDSPGDAGRLVNLLKGIKCKINIIPYNENESIDFKSPENEVVNEFAEYLAKRNFTVMVRWSKGREIKSACGQLAGE